MPFGFGMGEMVLVFLVVLLMTGGSRLPRIAAKLGKALRQFKGSMAEVEADLRAESVAALTEHSAPQARQHYGSAVRTVFTTRPSKSYMTCCSFFSAS